MGYSALDAVDAIEQFWSNTRKDNHRYQSWEHCYAVFSKAREQDSASRDYELLCLHLAFYLASWGMYRGSSFLLQKDYLCHMEVVREILDSKYDKLQGLDCSEESIDGSIKLLMKLKSRIVKLYSVVKNTVDNERLDKDSISDTLVTKVLLGTLGCTPAYDRYFVATAKTLKIAPRFSEKSIRRLAEYYRQNLEPINLRKEYAPGKLYPQMKILDMAFWQMGNSPKDNNKI